MARIYKIHPGIGIARVAPSTAGYFVAGETPGAPPFDIDDNGAVGPFGGYKDGESLMRRQAVRFTVFAYDRNDTTGAESLIGEVTAPAATIRWSVRLAAEKAALNTQSVTIDAGGARVIVPSTTRRNPSIEAGRLRTEVELSATGCGFKPSTTPTGTIMDTAVYLGEARTDADGRLIVLPGLGQAYHWAAAEPDLPDFYDNPGWYDDVADGTVDAEITVGSAAPEKAVGAWVLTAPPDFAPDTHALTTLYDIALQASNVPLPATLTWPQDIAPLFERAAGLFQTNTRPVWRTLAALVAAGTLPSAGAAERAAARTELLKAEAQMNSYRLTERQKSILRRYADGAYQAASDPGRPPETAPEALDRAALERCVGGGFFPGIEAGTIWRQPGIFTGLARLTRGSFQDHDGSMRQLTPGTMTGRMACPWHADFVDCAGNWWPSQRPDIVGRTSTGASKGSWAAEIENGDSHRDMIRHFARLGVVVRQADGTFEQVGRDPTLTGTS